MAGAGFRPLYQQTSDLIREQGVVMGNTKIIAVVLLALGAILLFFGFNASQSPIEELGEAFTGRYSDQTMAYFIAGGVAAVAGLFMLVKK